MWYWCGIKTVWQFCHLILKFSNIYLTFPHFLTADILFVDLSAGII